MVRKRILLKIQWDSILVKTLEKIIKTIHFFDCNEEDTKAEIDKLYRINTKSTKLRKVCPGVVCQEENKSSKFFSSILKQD